jgi:SpoIID/LytB domain protein
MGIALGLGIALNPPPANAQQPALNPTLRIGIVQRFGANAQDQLEIKPLPGDKLTLQFKTNDKLETVVVDSLKMDIQTLPLPQPEVRSRVVVSNHRSFESAEATAMALRQRGISVELAQPDQWQVWASRSQYPDPGSQATVLQQIRSLGMPNAFLYQRQLTQTPQLSWTANGFRYHRNILSITTGTNQVMVNKDRFVGRLRFQPNAYGTYTLVNHVPLETYLQGVVPYEIGAQAPAAAMQAQAIIARTYALRNLRRFQVDDYELCASTQCQVFQGLDAASPAINQAIAATQGKVLTYNNELVDTLYSSTTGGVTASFEDVWEGQPRPYLPTKIDASPNEIWDLNTKSLDNEQNFRAFINLKQGFNEDGWDYFRWTQESSLEKTNQDLRTFLQAGKHPLANFQTVKAMTVAQRSRGGRVRVLNVETDLGSVQLTKDEILRAFEAPNSLLFYVEPQYQAATATPSPNPAASAPATPAASPAAPTTPPTGQQVLKGFKFTGGGLGHAVGLSQTGSYRLSNLGWTADQILAFYYPGTQLQPLTSSVVYWTDPQAGTTPIRAKPIAQSPAQSPEVKQEGDRGFLGIRWPKFDISFLWDWFFSA